MRLLFAGTPDVAVPSLQALIDSPHEVVAVLTQPDAPTGRGRRLRPSAVAQAAKEAGIPVLKPERIADAADDLRALEIDAAVVVAYGQLLRREVLEIPRHGWFNLHFSLLPSYRGAAPVQRAVQDGLTTTGLSIFRLDEGLDTGDVALTAECSIAPDETAGDLLDRLAVDGGAALVRVMDEIAAGHLTLTPQAADGVSHAAKLTVEDQTIDFTADAAAVSARIRAVAPKPGAFAYLGGQRHKLLGVGTDIAPDGMRLEPGGIGATKRAVFVGTGTGPIHLTRIGPPGKQAMNAADWARGARLDDASRLTTTPEASGEQA